MSWENLIKDQSKAVGVHFINSHNQMSWQCMDIVKRKLILVTIGTWRVKNIVQRTYKNGLKHGGISYSCS